MDLVTVALAAGATAGLSGIATQAISGAYRHLMSAMLARFPKIDVASLEVRPSSIARQESLAEELQAAGADQDPEILRLARDLVEAIEREAPQAATSAGFHLERVRADSIVVGRQSDLILNVHLGGEIAIGAVIGSRNRYGRPAAPVESREPALYWNTRFPRNIDILDLAHTAHRRLPVGATYLLTTAVEPEGAADGLSTRVIDAAGLFGTMIVFELQGFGVTFAAASLKEPAPDDGFREFVRSRPLRCTATGTRPFSVWCRIEHSGSVLIEARLVVRNNKLLDQRIQLIGVDSLAQPSTSPVRRRGVPALRAKRMNAEAVGEAPLIDVRLTVARSGDVYQLRCDRQGWSRRSDRAAQGAASIESAVSGKRRELVALSRQYSVPPDGDGFALQDRDGTLLRFAQVGATLHEVLFGLPRDRAVDSDTRGIAASLAGFGRDPALRWDFQIDSPLVPIPWGLLYDARYYHDRATAERTGQGGDYPPFPRSGSEVDTRCFWGGRFNIIRTFESDDFPQGELGNGDIRLQPVLNVSVGADVVARQRDLLKAIGGAPLAIDPVVDDVDVFLRWAQTGQVSDLLYLFCHATTPEEFDSLGRWKGGQSTWDESRLGLAQFGGPLGNGTVSLADLRDAWIDPRERRPLVFLNACTSAVTDPVFAAPFVRHFLGSWQARTFIGTDCEIPSEFADAFSRIVVDGLCDGLDVALALRRATSAALAVGNPFGLIYALHGRSDIRFGHPQIA